ncbi:hypothetical protein [Hymenobacter algoricola]|uniref:hypothetical protein n=1 Tax=Hymenobacter algoricola TaxID=486267 RepID=UPI0031E9FB2B
MREQGRNAGAEVERIIKFAGGRVGDAWCSWYAVACMRWAGVLVPRFGAARAWFDKVHTVYLAGHPVPGKPAPQPADLLGFRWGNPQISHVEILKLWGTGAFCRSLGGNTGGGGARQREGEGVYENWRQKRQVWAVANVIDNPKY